MLTEKQRTDQVLMLWKNTLILTEKAQMRRGNGNIYFYPIVQDLIWQKFKMLEGERKN